MAVFDASVVVGLFISRPWSDVARRFFAEDSDPIAPAFLVIEVASAFRSNAKAGFITEGDALEALVGIASGFRLTPDDALIESTFAIAIAADHSVYDCLYLALAEREGDALVTADRRLAAVARQRGIEALLVGA